MGLQLREEMIEAERKENSGSAQCGWCVPYQPQLSGPDCVFEYGNLRPDAVSDVPFSSSNASRAWLLGSRLYSFNHAGGQRPAVRLEESGYAVLGYVVKASPALGIAGLLDKTERSGYSPELYERDIVEVTTEKGDRVKCYVYHRPDVDRTRPVQDGDWSKSGGRTNIVG